MKRVIAGSLTLVIFLLVLCSCGGAYSTVALDNTSLSLNVGDSRILTATTITPAEETTLTWTSSDTSVAKVSNGVVEAVGEGTAIITVMDLGGMTSTCTVTVSSAVAKSITMDEYPTTMKVGTTNQILITVDPPEAMSTIKWTSSDTSVAVVDSDGYVTAVKKGVVNIECSSPNGVHKSCNIIVKPKRKPTQPTTQPPQIIIMDPVDIGNRYSNEFIFYDSSYRYLSYDEVCYLSEDEAQRAINEIYARNGYVFDDSAYQDYYSAQFWYSANPYFTENDFNSYEKANIELLSEFR